MLVLKDLKRPVGSGWRSLVTGERGVLILAGGESRRMGGVDKAFLELDGIPLIKLVAGKALQLTDGVVVVIRRGVPEAPYLGILPRKVKLTRDEVEGKGPLAGFVSGMRSINARYAVVLPCDTPFVNLKVLEHIFKRGEGADAALPRWPSGYIEPLQAVYRVETCLPSAEEALKAGRLFIIDLLPLLRRVVFVPIEEVRSLDPHLHTFFNINTPRDLEAGRLLKQTSMSTENQVDGK